MLFQTRKNEKLPVRRLLWGLLFLSGLFLNQPSLSADTRSPSAGSPLLDDANLHAVQFLGKNTGWAVGDRGVIRKTEDGGRTWQFVASPVDCPLKSICFLTNQIGWIAGRIRTWHPAEENLLSLPEN